MNRPVPTAAERLGQTCRDLRGYHKMDEVARAVTAAGIPWSTGRVAHLEAGRVSPVLTTLFVLASAFSSLLERPVTLADLLAGDGPVSLGDSTIDLADLRAALQGQPVAPPTVEESAAATMARVATSLRAEKATWPARLLDMPAGRERITAETWREGDERAAASLGVSRSRALAEMAYLWGQSLTAQRDQEAGPDANQQRRGRISRKLLAQLKESMAHGDDH